MHEHQFLFHFFKQLKLLASKTSGSAVFPLNLKPRNLSSNKNNGYTKETKMPVEIDQEMVTEAVQPSPKKQKTMPSESITIRFAKLSDNAFAPTRGSKLAAGYDLYSAYDEVVPAKGKMLVKTDIQIALPDGCYGRVAPRSGLAHKHFIDVGAGVIDQDYRGNVGVIMFNFNDKDFEVKKGDRIAQLICERIYLPDLVEEESLDDTERGSGGFGSTGKN